MMEKEVIRVACPSQYLASTSLDIKKKRVAAYARVSTDSEDQIHSFKAQIDEYTKKITSNPDWEFVGMYSDVSNILLAMGMMMVSPMTISLPFKLMLFVLVSGWDKLVEALALTYR